jgi:hypothetical protein
VKNLLHFSVIVALFLYVGCAQSPTSPHETPVAALILTSTGSSSVADIIRKPDKSSYTQGDTVTMVACPHSGYAFAGWSGDIEASEDTLRIIMKKNTTIFADFINTASGKKVYTVTTNALNGTISISPPGGVYESGTSVTVSAQPDYGFTFSGWEGASVAAEGNATLTVEKNVALTAHFSIDPNAVFAILHISPAPVNGKIVLNPPGVQSGDGYKFKPGADVVVSAVPDNTYELASWGGDLVQTSTGTTSISVTMNRDRTVSATFSKAPVGAKWTARTSDIGYGLISAIWDGKQTVVSGNGGAILASPDGITWTSMVIDSNACLNCVIFAGGRYVTVGDDGMIFTSKDAKQWVKQNSTTTYSLQCVVWTGTQYVAVGGYIRDSGTNYNCVLTSPDGATWTSQSGGTGIWYGLVWTGSKLIAVGYDFDYSTVADYSSSVSYTSTDGKTWQWGSGSIPRYASLVSLIWAQNRALAVGGCRNTTDGYQSSVYTSTDGDSWEGTLVDTREFLNGVTWTGTNYVAVGNSGVVFTGTDNTGWKEQSSGTTRDIYAVAWTGTQLVAVGNSGLILTSP